MLLQGKKLLITGVLTPQSLAFGVAEHALAQGAEVILTGFGRAKSLTERSATRSSPSSLRRGSRSSPAPRCWSWT